MRLDEKPFFMILRSGTPIGTLSWMRGADYARFGEFYLFTRCQGQGVGMRSLQQILSQADSLYLPVRLEVPKWNPAARLYHRPGFRCTSEPDIHILLEQPARDAAQAR